MPGPVTRDSITKCSPGNDLYAMIRNPTAKMPAQPTKPVDTIKSLQGQMERDAVARLGKAMQNFIFVARAGKFVFLAIAMPPYILFYGLPKWVIADFLPNLFQHGLKPFHVANEKIKKLFKTNDQDKGLISSLKNAFTAISTKATEYINWVNRTSKALFVHLKHQTVALGYRLLQPYMPALKNGMKAAEQATKMIFQKTYEKGEKHAEIARQFVSFAWKTVKQEFTHQFRPYVELVKNQFNTTRKQLKKIIEKPRIEIQKFKTALTRRLKRTNEVLKSTGLNISKNASVVIAAAASYIARPIIEWASPKIQWSASLFQSGREKMIRNFEQIRGFLQNIASGLQDAARMSRNTVIATVKNVFEAVIPAFVKHFFNPEGGFKKQSQEFFQKFGKKIKKLKTAALQYAMDSLKAAKSQFFEFLHKIQRFFTYLGRQIKEMPKRLFRLAVKSYQLSIYTSIKTGHFLRWISIWSRVLGRLAWQELRETTSLIIKASNRKSSEKVD